MNLGGAKVKAGLCSTLYTGHGRELAGKACVHYGRGTNLVDYWEGIFPQIMMSSTYASQHSPARSCNASLIRRCGAVSEIARKEHSNVAKRFVLGTNVTQRPVNSFEAMSVLGRSFVPNKKVNSF